jgi:hypothetical protein
MILLIYDSNNSDGLGSLLQRVIAIYCICRHFNLKYVHTYFKDIRYQGLKALAKNENDINFVHQVNKKFYKEGDIDITKIKYKIIRKQSINLKELKEYNNLSQNILIIVSNPYHIADKIPVIYLHAKTFYKTQIKKNKIFTIGIHVRRGELFCIDSHRMLPNYFYIEKALSIVKVLESYGIDFIIELYTEVPEKEIEVTGDHPGIINRIKDTVILKPEDNKIEEFNILPNLNKYINEDILITFDRMINSDIFIMSRSSLSFSAAVLKQGTSICKKFWHNLPEGYIDSDSPNYEEEIDDFIVNNFIKKNTFDTIPKKIIQVWLQGGMYLKYKKNLLKLNPFYDYEFFDEKKCISFIKDNYPLKILECFQNLKNMAHKSDLFRYCYLYKKGGIYLDLDLELLKSFDSIYISSDKSNFITALGSNSFKGTKFGECTNGFIMTTPHNSLFKDLIKFILDNMNTEDYGYYIKHLYFSLNNPTPFKKFKLKDIDYYLYKEYSIENENFILDKDQNTIINSNGNGYLNLNIGIIGNGFVGKATQIFKNSKVKVLTYDIIPELCVPLELTLKELCETCDIIFVSVPTPTNKDGSCHLKILESVIKDINEYVDLNEIIVVIRSTVPPGTSDNLNCYFMPEFLTEKNFKKDFIENEDWICGLKNTSQDFEFMEKINYLINKSFIDGKIKYNNVNYLKNKEAEMVKLFRNNFLALKVSFCNEVAEFCKLKNINYENIRQQAVKDQRIGASHSCVPGHDGHYGYGGTCFPKDSKSLLYEINKTNMKSYIIQSMDERNDNVDRKEEDWEKNKGRFVID